MKQRCAQHELAAAALKPASWMRRPIALLRHSLVWLVIGMVIFADSESATAAEVVRNYPEPRSSQFVARNFRFHDGTVLSELRLHVTTVGEASGEPVLVLHGTAGSAASFLTPAFAGELFGPGQPLDARRYFVILPDAIGAGRSAKPSDGLKAAFPAYNYADMVAAQHLLVTEHLGIRHLRAVVGNSMGGMHAWMWAQIHPAMMDLVVPMASMPSPMSGRNWILRRLITDSIRNDPAWQGGNYVDQPPSARFAAVFYNFASNGGNLALQAAAPTSAAANRLLDQRLNARFDADANDLLYQWASSVDYDASQQIGAIRARVLAINAADDERNPPELGVMERAMVRLPTGSRLVLIPASAQTAGHGTTAQARFYKEHLARELVDAPRP